MYTLPGAQPAGEAPPCSSHAAPAPLLAEHALLLRELGRVQERVTGALAERTRELRELESRLARARGQLAERDAVIALLRAELEQLRRCRA